MITSDGMEDWEKMVGAEDAELESASNHSKWHRTVLVREAKESLTGLSRLRDWALGECETRDE